jgi:hypothetical protein
MYQWQWALYSIAPVYFTVTVTVTEGTIPLPNMQHVPRHTPMMCQQGLARFISYSYLFFLTAETKKCLYSCRIDTRYLIRTGIMQSTNNTQNQSTSTCTLNVQANSRRAYVYNTHAIKSYLWSHINVQTCIFISPVTLSNTQILHTNSHLNTNSLQYSCSYTYHHSHPISQFIEHINQSHYLIR